MSDLQNLDSGRPGSQPPRVVCYIGPSTIDTDRHVFQWDGTPINHTVGGIVDGVAMICYPVLAGPNDIRSSWHITPAVWYVLGVCYC